MSADDEQQVQMTLQEAAVLRGAINVVLEIEGDPDLEAPLGLDLDGARMDVYETIEERLERRIEQFDPPAQVTDVFNPTEAQAIRDAVGGLRTMLEDPAGKRVLAEVGFLVAPDQDVADAEIRTLELIAQKLEPTGVRPNGDRPDGELVDDDASPAAAIDTARTEIRSGTVPFVGLEALAERAQAVVVDADRRLRGGRCPGWARQAVELLKAALIYNEAGQRLPDIVDDAHDTVVRRVRELECMSDDAAFDLRDEWNRLTSRVGNQQTLEDQALDYLDALEDGLGWRGLEGDLPAVAGPGAAALPDVPVEDVTDEELLNRVDRLRSELDTVLEESPITDDDEVQAQIRAALPGRGADCGQLLVALAELAQIDAQIVAGAGGPVRMFDTSDVRRLVNAVADARRIVIGAMQDRNCLGRETLSALRGSFLEIHDPLEGTDAALQARAFDAITDIRNALLDPRRGGGGSTRLEDFPLDVGDVIELGGERLELVDLPTGGPMFEELRTGEQVQYTWDQFFDAYGSE